MECYTAVIDIYYTGGYKLALILSAFLPLVAFAILVMCEKRDEKVMDLK
jgi:hypothetical protein